MSEASYLAELREAAPPAPERLRELVRTLPAPKPRVSLKPRPALSAALASCRRWAWQPRSSAATPALTPDQRERRRLQAAVTLLVLADNPCPKGLFFRRRAQRSGGVRTDAHREVAPAAPGCLDEPARQRPLRAQPRARCARRGGSAGSSPAPTTRPARTEGNSRLALRVPVANLQKAIASFTQLGTILSQHISVADLQGGLDRLDTRIATARRAGRRARSPKRLERRRDALVREGTYASVSRCSSRPRSLRRNTWRRAGSTASGITQATFWVRN